jgi:excisionase family DNA binding protein
MPDEVLTVQEVAAMLRTTPATVYAWCRAGKLPAFKIGQQWRIRARALEGIMQRGDLPSASSANGGGRAGQKR